MWKCTDRYPVRMGPVVDNGQLNVLCVHVGEVSEAKMLHPHVLKSSMLIANLLFDGKNASARSAVVAFMQ